MSHSAAMASRSNSHRSSQQAEEDEFEQEFVEFCNGLPCVYLFAFVILGLVVLAGVLGSSVSLSFVVVLCFVPTALIAYFAYVRNHLDAVPPTAAIHSFCWGAVGSFPVLAIQILSVAYFTGAWDLLGEPEKPDDKPNVTRALFFSIFQAFIVCAITEESLKYLVVTEFTGPSLANRAYGVVVLCICAGLGFSTVENLGYVIFDDSNVGVFVALMRAILDVCCHTVTAALIGVRIALGDHERYSFMEIMFVPFLIHGVYDVFLMIPNKLGDAYPMLGLLPMVSLFVVVAAGAYAAQQVGKVTDYEIIGQSDEEERSRIRHSDGAL